MTFGKSGREWSRGALAATEESAARAARCHWSVENKNLPSLIVDYQDRKQLAIALILKAKPSAWTLQPDALVPDALDDLLEIIDFIRIETQAHSRSVTITSHSGGHSFFHLIDHDTSALQGFSRLRRTRPRGILVS